MKTAYLIHGWEGNPDNCWFPWLKKELEERGYKVFAPAMPDPDAPEINSWVQALQKTVEPDSETILIGHSIGCQTILRYLASLDPDVHIKGVFFVAGFVRLKGLESEEEEEIARPWLDNPIDWEKVRQHVDKVVAIFSDNDEFIDVDNAQTFKEKLDAKIIIEHDKGHFDDEAGATELPSLLQQIVASDS